MEASESDGAAGPLPREVGSGLHFTREMILLAFFVLAAAAAWHLLV